MRESKSESVLHKYLALTSCLLENGGMLEPVPYVALTGLLKLAGDSTRRWNYKWISIHQGWHSLEYSSYKPKRHSIVEHDSRNSFPKGLALIKVFPQFLVPEPD